MEVMLSGHQLYGASLLTPGAGDLVNRLPPQGKPGSSPWAPLRPTRRGIQGNGCCWRRGPLSLAEDGARPLELTQEVVSLPGRLVSARGEEGGGVGSGRPVLAAGSTAHGEGCPSLGAPTIEEAEGGSCHGAGPHTQVEGGSCHGADPHTEVEGGSCHGADPHTEVEGGSCHGADPRTEVEGGSCHGVGPLTDLESGACHGADSAAEIEDGSFHRVGPPAEVEDGFHHEPGLGAVAENGPSHGAGLTMGTDGAGQTVEKECGSRNGAGPGVEADDEPCHGAGATGGPYHGAGHTIETSCEPYSGAGRRGDSQDYGNCVGKDGAFTDLPELQQQQCRHRGIQLGKERAPEMTGMLTHPCAAWAHWSPTSVIDLCPTGLVTTTTAARDGQAHWLNASPQENKEPEENDDEFGTFEKAGNLVLWAESADTVWLEDERLLNQSGNTAASNREAAEDMDDHRTWRPWPEAPSETVQHRASHHGSSDSGVESWESRSPHLSASPTSRGGWTAFCSDSRGGGGFDAFSPMEREAGQRGGGGHWWSTGPLERPAFPKRPSPSAGRGVLESVFHSCFPTVSTGGGSPDAFPTLERILGSTEERGGEGLPSGQARELWASLRDIDEAVGLQHKRTGCRSHGLLLRSLRVDPANADLPGGCTTNLGSPPQPSRERRLESFPSPVALGRDSRELALIKNSIPQHQMNGFSPSHRIQAFFYHWTQADRNGRSKAPYDVNKNFMA